MSATGPRYAIYFVPTPDSDLYKFGASIIGYDCYSGSNVTFADGIDATDWAPVVRAPRKYGFHATLKAPFFLDESTNEVEFCCEVQDFAAAQPIIRIGRFVVSALGSFIALVPLVHCTSISRLAQNSVEIFDRFRAPLKENNRQSRARSELSARQVENLERWGYPYVADDFRFHMTLTDSLSRSDREKALSFLCHKFETISGPAMIDQIVVVRQIDISMPFQVVRVAPLGYSPYRPFAYSF